MAKKTFEKHDLGGVVIQYSKGPNLTITIGKEKRSIKKTDLWMLVFMNSKGKAQDDLIPVWEKEMLQFTRQHQIRATRDIKAGEMIKYHCDVNVPKIVVESLLRKEGVTDPSAVMKPAEEIPKDDIELRRRGLTRGEVKRES